MTENESMFIIENCIQMKEYEWDRIIYEYADRGCSELEENTTSKLSWARINGDKTKLEEAPGTNATVRYTSVKYRSNELLYFRFKHSIAHETLAI